MADLEAQSKAIASDSGEISIQYRNLETLVRVLFQSVKLLQDTLCVENEAEAEHDGFSSLARAGQIARRNPESEEDRPIRKVQKQSQAVLENLKRQRLETFES